MTAERALLPLSDIEADDDLQPRVTTDHNVSHEYGLAMARGDVFPPIDVFWDGETYWLADGFHRYFAAEALGLVEIDCTVHQGSYDDALWFTVSANRTNGLHRKRADVQLAIERALLHPRTRGWSDAGIAEEVGCSPPTVAPVRADLIARQKLFDVGERTGRDGKTYKTEKITNRAKPKAEPEPEPLASGQTDIEDVQGVKQPAKVAPLIDPAWAHLSEQLHAVVKAHAKLPGPGVAAAN